MLKCNDSAISDLAADYAHLYTDSLELDIATTVSTRCGTFVRAALGINFANKGVCDAFVVAQGQ